MGCLRDVCAGLFSCGEDVTYGDILGRVYLCLRHVTPLIYLSQREFCLTVCICSLFCFSFFARYSIHNSGIGFSVKKVSGWFIRDSFVLEKGLFF